MYAKSRRRKRSYRDKKLKIKYKCSKCLARRDGPSHAGSRCQTLNRTPQRRHALDPSSADARAPANPRRARRVHAKSRRRKRSYRDKKLPEEYKCPKYLARRDGPSHAGSRCQKLNRTPKRRHALDTSSADARAPANPQRARRVHARSRRRKRSYPRRSPRPLCPRISILVLAKRTTGTTCFSQVCTFRAPFLDFSVICGSLALMTQHLKKCRDTSAPAPCQVESYM